MRQHAKRLTVLALAAVSVALVGCDGPQTQRDKEVQENIRKARQESPAKVPATQAAVRAADQAAAFYEAAAKVQGASLDNSIDARMFVGQDNYNRAIAMLGQLDDLESAATGALCRIQSGAAAIDRNNVQIRILAASDPSEVVKASEKAKADQAAESAAAAALLKKTQDDATAQEAKIKETQSKLAAATDEMNQLFQKSELTQGQESVDLYSKAVGVRQTVQKTSHELAEQQLELSRMQRTIGEATVARQTADASIAATQKNIEQVNAIWAETQKAIAACNEENKKVMESQIVPEAKNYATSMAGAAKVRQEIEQRLDKAIAAYQAAWKDAGALQRDFMTWKNDPNNTLNPSMPARKSLADTNDPLWYSMLVAKATLAKGMLSLNLVKLLDRQNVLVVKDLKPVLLEAKVMAPAELTPSDMTSQITGATSKAEALFNDADGVFLQAMDSSIPALSRESGMLRVASQYAIYALKDFKSAPNLQTAQVALKHFAEAGLPIPRLPAELESRTITRIGPAPQINKAPPPVTPGDGTPAPATQATPVETTTPTVPAGPGGAGPGIGMPDLSGLTNIIPGMKKKGPNKPAPTPNDNK
ncbi:MAG: hypothetical protein ABSH20_17760 [Tepidisphaeraceae bacterium]|jgi:hypothetical protein